MATDGQNSSNRARLTTDQRETIRVRANSGETIQSLANQYNVSYGTIQAIKKPKSQNGNQKPKTPVLTAGLRNLQLYRDIVWHVGKGEEIPADLVQSAKDIVQKAEAEAHAEMVRSAKSRI